MSHSTKNGSFGGYFSNSTPDFPPKCRHFGHPFAIILHLFGLKTIETLALNRFYPYSASPILKGGKVIKLPTLLPEVKMIQSINFGFWILDCEEI